MKTNQVTFKSALKYMFGILVVFALVISGCRKNEDSEPDDDGGNNNGGSNDSTTTVMDTTLISTFDGSGTPMFSSSDWTVNSDSIQLDTGHVAYLSGFADNSTDSSFHITGTEYDSTGNYGWWIGEIASSESSLGLSADSSHVTMRLSVYFNNSNSNFQIQLIEGNGDGEEWKLNAGDDAGANLDPGSRSFGFTLDQFSRLNGNGDNALIPADINKIKIGIGADAGNTADIFVDDIKFIQEIEQ